MRLLRLLVAGVLGLAPIVLTAAPAHADSGPVDLQVRNDPASGKVGEIVAVHTHLFNRGPGDTQTSWVMHEYLAPTGTELVGTRGSTTLTWYPFTSPRCTWLTPKVHVQCISQAGYWYIPNGEGGNPDYGLFVGVKILGPVTKPGRVGAACHQSLCVDRDPSNNSASIVVRVITPTPSKTPTHKPTATTPAAPPAPTPTLAAAPALTVTPSDTPTPDLTPSQTPLETVEAARSGDGSNVVPIVTFSAGSLAILGAAGYLTFLRLRRRRHLLP